MTLAGLCSESGLSRTPILQTPQCRCSVIIGPRMQFKCALLPLLAAPLAAFFASSILIRNPVFAIGGAITEAYILGAAAPNTVDGLAIDGLAIEQTPQDSS